MKNLFLLVALFISFAAVAQKTSTSGVITDSSGLPLPGATVAIKGTTTGTVTDVNGNFQLEVESGDVLVASFVGYQSQEVSYAGESTLNFKLQEAAIMSKDVVVIGYQTVKKADLTGAVSVLDAKSVENQTVVGTAGEVLGALPGIMVRTEGSPGSEGMVEIRGTSSFGSSQPLYVLDGIPLEGSANRDLNFNDVESIQVLKDASAAAIYGSRAANGVIIVTTKKGNSKQLKIDVNARKTFQVLPEYDLMGRDEWISANDQAFINNGEAVRTHSTGDTDWQDETFKTGVIDDYNVSFSGGNKDARYFISANYQSNSGTSVGTSSERISLRSNTSVSRDFGENIRFTLGENIAISNYSLDQLSTNPMFDVAQMLPTIPVYDEDNYGGYGYGDSNGDIVYANNPIAIEDLLNVTSSNLRIRGTVFTELELWKMFKYKFNFGMNTSNDMYSSLRKEGNWRYNEPEVPTSLNKNQARSNSFVFDNTLEFTKDFGKHSVNAVLGTSYMANNYEQIWATKNSLLIDGNGDYFDQLDAASEVVNASGYRDLDKLFSIFGRVNYNYAERYLFSFTMRRDDSSKFNPDNSVGYFPSASAAWRLSEEDFFNVSWIDNIKLRASYGVLGSSNIGSWDWVGFINSYPQIAIGDDQHIEQGQIQSKLTNNNLTWEKQKTTNIGVDFAVLRNRLSVTAEVFNTKTEDVLTPMEILLTTGNAGGNPYVNAATIHNKGYELSLTWKDKVNDFDYSANLNISQVKNKVDELGYGRQEFTTDITKTVVGGAIGDWYLVKTDGLFRSDSEVSEWKAAHPQDQTDWKPGDIRFVDANGDGQITDADRQYVGSPWPKLELGFNGFIAWKGFDFQLQLTGAFGYDVFNDVRAGYDAWSDWNWRSDYDAWSVDNVDAKDPRYLANDSRNGRYNSDRWIENGSYLRIKQLALGYTFTDHFNIKYIDKLRLYTNFQNVLTFTKYTGLDAEFRNNNIWKRGVDAGAYPNPFGFTLGAQITF